jgi:hypothetical protein
MYKFLNSIQHTAGKGNPLKPFLSNSHFINQNFFQQILKSIHMNFPIITIYQRIRTGLLFLLFLGLVIRPMVTKAQMTTLAPGSFIINMGVVPQTVGNGLKPYGMIYDLIVNNKIPIKWIISPGKVKDGVDFTYNGVDYKGGPFIIQAEYRTAAVNTRIAYWQTQGVLGITTTSPIEVPVAMTLLVSSVPRWTMDLLNGRVAVPYFTNAGIPASAYSLTKLPSALGYCDDIFVMPHAYPQWSTHSNLYFWNLNYKGSIWLSCTAGSELEDMFNPADHSQQTNFLSDKVASVAFPTGTVTTVENALKLYNHHTNGTPPYTYTSHGDPFMQFLGSIDAATQNGLEQVYIPILNGGWRSTTTIGAYDPDHAQVSGPDAKYRAAIIAYGRGFGDPNRGYVMIEAAHSLNNAQLPANIAAQRAFFNFSFMSGKDATVVPDLTGIPSSVVSGTPTAVYFEFPVGANPNDYTVSWYSACGGTFAANPAYPSDKTKAIYTPPVVTTTTSCPITVGITDICGRVYNNSKTSVVSCDIQVVTTLTNSCFGSTNGTITMSITGAAGPFVWTWALSGGGSGSGTGTSITGLAAGTYTVTVTSGNGAGSSKVFSVTIAANPSIGSLSATPTNILCNALTTGSITLANVTGGTPPFTFLWSDGATTQNRSGLAAGTYSVTATDASNCSVTSSSIVITQPTAITITPTITNVNCFGNTSGAVSLVISGGTGTKSCLWNDGSTSQNRTGLLAGTYSVVVTDANNCTKTLSGIVVSQPAAALSLSATSVNIACYGGSTGSINLTASGGTLPYSYNWGGGITSEDRSDLAAGTYSVTVTDASGCTAVLSKTITQSINLTLSTVLTNESCPGVADGAIALTVTGGTGTYTYSWTGPATFTPTPQTTEDISGLQDGAYTVVVTDGSGCTATLTVTINTTNSNPVAPSSIH